MVRPNRLRSIYSFLATGRKPLDPTRDFTPIAEVSRNEFLVATHNGLPANNIPEYKQGLLPDLLAGRVHLLFAPAPSIRELIGTGKLKVLATLAPQRSPATSDRPTLMETGFPGFWHVGLLYLYAPGATPRGTVLRLNREVRNVVDGAAFRARLAGLGDAPGTPMSSDEAIAVLRERRAWTDKVFAIAMGAAKTRQAER